MKNKKAWMIIIIAILIILVDQVTKFVVQKNFGGQFIGNNIIGIEVTTNDGMAFGFNSGNAKNIGITIFALVIIINFLIKQFERIDNKTAVVIAFILGGGIGNLIDRFIRGTVLDFIKIYKFPNFNIADTFIVIGWILLVIFLIIYTRSGEKESAK